MKNLIIKLKKYGVIFSLFFGNLLYGFIVFVLLISTAMLASYFILEYFLLEDGVVYAMKKSKIFLSQDIFLSHNQFLKLNNFNRIGLTPRVTPSLFQVSYLSNSTCLSIPLDFLISNSKQIITYKSSFSTFKNYNTSVPVIDFSFNMTLEYLRTHIFYFNYETVDSFLLKYLPSNIYEHMCQSIGMGGFYKHGWLVIYDESYKKFLIGLCSHDSQIEICNTVNLRCGKEAVMHKIMANMDFNYNFNKKQYMRNFLVFADAEFNKGIFEYITENKIKSGLSHFPLNENLILKLINLNEFTFIDSNGKFFSNFNNKGFISELPCCRSFKTLVDISNQK